MNNNTSTAIMVPIQPSQAQAQRKNRRRERPGARKRHALALAHEVAEGMDMALDHTPLPFQHSHLPSHAQTRQHQYDRSWKAWKAKEVEAEELKRKQQMVDSKERARQQEKKAYTRLFGGGEDDDQPREFTISYASIKKSRQKHRITKPRITPAVKMSTRRPVAGFAMSLPLRPARTSTAQIEQLPLPTYTPNTIAAPQSLPTTSNRGSSTMWNSNSFSVTLPFHPAPTSVSAERTTSQQQGTHINLSTTNGDPTTSHPQDDDL